jgi:tetratricopeptide (TPR) repeat protein
MPSILSKLNGRLAGERVSPEIRKNVLGVLDRLRSLCWNSLQSGSSNMRELETALDSLAQVNPSGGAMEVLLFLARRKMEPVDCDGRDHRAAWDYLERTASLAGIAFPFPTEVSFNTSIAPRLVRALTSAYYNAGAVLHNAFHPELARRFLERSVYIASEAVRLCDTSNSSEELEHVRQQLHRRWELLAITYSTLGERRAAYDAYRQAILHASDEGLKKLVERYTKIGATQLLSNGTENSLAKHLEVKGWDKKRIGLTVEMQISALEGSMGKREVAIHVGELIREALSLWDGKQWPFRRARYVSYWRSGFQRLADDPNRMLVRLMEHVTVVESVVNREPGCDMPATMREVEDLTQQDVRRPPTPPVL